jgi:hypothetical protein
MYRIALAFGVVLFCVSCAKGGSGAADRRQPCAPVRPAAVIPFEFLGKHIFADARLDGKGPFDFVVDTGGVNLISPELQARLGLRTSGRETGRGVGSQSVQSGETIVPLTQLGAAVFKQRPYYVYPLDAIYANGGVPLQGMVGNQLFRAFVMRIDYGAQTISLIKRADFEPGCSGTAVPLTIDDNELFVPGAFDGIPGRFRIDTGSGAMLDIDAPFVHSHHLLNAFPHRLATTDTGIGGSVGTYVVCAHRLNIGRVAVPNPITGLSVATGGNFALANVSGNIGNGALARFVVTIDFARRVLYLAPASKIPPGLDSYDRSGLVLRWSQPNFTVSGVAAPSPAAAAGIRPGDVIVAVNGTPARKMTLLGVRAMLSGERAGTPIALTLERASLRRTVTFRLRDLF